jgi:molybdopterin-guanine dinucleotide biosynthesis protein A
MAGAAGSLKPGQIAAVVLAGGRASRLGGADKPSIRILGRSLLATVTRAAIGAGASRIVIVGPPRPDLVAEVVDGFPQPDSAAGVSIEFTTEHPPGSGPVPALRAALEVVAEPRLVLLAADLPFLRAGHVRALLASTNGATVAGSMFVDGQGRPQWLASCWRTASLRSALQGYQGNSLGGLLGPLRPTEITTSAVAGQPPGWLDLDTREDLAEALALATQESPLAERQGSQ